MVKVFIDASGWAAIMDRKNDKNAIAREYFQQLLDKNARIYSHILEINQAIETIKKECSLNLATDFSKLIDEAIISANMHVSWHSRRLRRAALRQ
jgi:predicted nucleic acid-binding protein